MTRRGFAVLPPLLSAVVAALPVESRADASSWSSFGGGLLTVRDGDAPENTRPFVPIDLGVGTDPRRPVIAGGLLRLLPIVDAGADLALVARVATSGFQSGGFGLAVDAGGYLRFWGEESEGLTASLALGLPVAAQLTVLGSLGRDGARAYGAALGVDLLRLTVYRTFLEDRWVNPLPAQRGVELAAR